MIDINDKLSRDGFMFSGNKQESVPMNCTQKVGHLIQFLKGAVFYG